MPSPAQIKGSSLQEFYGVYRSKFDNLFEISCSINYFSILSREKTVQKRYWSNYFNQSYRTSFDNPAYKVMKDTE